MTALEPISTAVVARPMPMPFMATVVMARVGHMPSTRRNVGFSRRIPRLNSFKIHKFAHLLLVGAGTGAGFNCIYQGV